jgi:hypothetical protein
VNAEVVVFPAVDGLLVGRQCVLAELRSYRAHHQELFQTAVAASGCRVNVEVVVFPAVVGLLVAD